MNNEKIVKDFMKRVKEYQENDEKILTRLKIKKVGIINHPRKQRVGFFARFLVNSLGRMGYVIDSRFHNLKQ